MPLQALNLYGIYRLSARIFNLKESGHNIDTKMIHVGPVKFAKYVMRWAGANHHRTTTVETIDIWKVCRNKNGRKLP